MPWDFADTADEHAPALGSEGGIQEGFGEILNSTRRVPKTPTITEHGRSLPDRPQPTEGRSAALGSVRPHFTYLP